MSEPGGEYKRTLRGNYWKLENILTWEELRKNKRVDQDLSRKCSAWKDFRL